MKLSSQPRAARRVVMCNDEVGCKQDTGKKIVTSIRSMKQTEMHDLSLSKPCRFTPVQAPSCATAKSKCTVIVTLQLQLYRRCRGQNQVVVRAKYSHPHDPTAGAPARRQPPWRCPPNLPFRAQETGSLRFHQQPDSPYEISIRHLRAYKPIRIGLKTFLVERGVEPPQSTASPCRIRQVQCPVFCGRY